MKTRDSTRYICRAYIIAAGQDLFDKEFVTFTYWGRIGVRVRTKTIWLPDEVTTHRYVRQCIKKRENASKRMGISYKVKKISGITMGLVDWFSNLYTNIMGLGV